MANPSVTVLRSLRPNLTADGPTDAALLTRYVVERDTAAFELLVWRYAGLVLQVCRAVTRDHHAAEDAAQATFLALARKAASVSQGAAVPAWLTTVARRIAVRAAKRAIPLSVAELDSLPGRAESGRSAEEARVLHDELARLPDRFRVPILLCYFDGLTQLEAARRLGWPVGTVASRIDRGKEKLHRRLTGRGVLVPAIGLAATAATPNFVSATTHASLAFAAGSATNLGTSMTVLELANGAMRTMTIAKLQWTAGLIAACGMLTVGGVWAAGQGPGVGPAGAAPAAAAQPKPADAPAAEPAKPLNADSAQRKRSLNNLKQIMLAIHNYHDTYGFFPSDIRDATGKALLSWRVAILPYLEQDNLYKQFKLAEPWDSEHNLKLANSLPKVYRVGIEAKDSTHTYYQGFAGPGTVFEPKAKLGFNSITDGTSNTIGVVEAGPPVVWTKPADIAYDPKKPLPKPDGPFANALHVAMMDGSTCSLKRGIDAAVFNQLITRDGGEVIPGFVKLHAHLPAETPEEKAELKKLLDENQAIVQQIEKSMKEHVELLKGKNGVIGDLTLAEEHQEQLRRMLDGLKAMNKEIRDELGGVPKVAPMLKK